MRVLIVDDEPLARLRLKRLLNENHPHFLVIGEAQNGVEALTLAKMHLPQVVFLDIEMPLMNGLELAEQLNLFKIPPALVFITAHTNHALAAIQTIPTGYLVKPLEAEALAKVIASLGKLNRAQLESQKEASIQYQLGSNTRQLLVSEVLYIEADDKFSKVFHHGGEVLLDTSLKQLELKYPQQLLRIHRKILINQNKLDALFNTEQGLFVSLTGLDKRLEVSRRESKKVKLLFQTQ